MLLARQAPTPAYRGVVYVDTDDCRIFFDTVAAYRWVSAVGSRIISCDIETDGLGADQFGIKCVTFSDGFTSVILDPRDPVQASTVVNIIDKATNLVFHNAAFDVPSLIANGLMEFRHIAKVHDTVIYARLAMPDVTISKGLEALATARLGISDTVPIGAVMKAAGFATQEAGWKGMDVTSFVYCNGAMMDTRVTHRLLGDLQAAAQEVVFAVREGIWSDWASDDALGLVEREQAVNRVMLYAGARGMRFDPDYYQGWKATHDDTVAAAADRLAADGLDPGNGAQLVERLNDMGQLPPGWPRTGKTGQLAARAADVEKLTHPLAVAHLEYKRLTRVSGYLAKCADMAGPTGRVHPMAGILGASATGRMSYSSPELQQFPGDARGVLCADPGQRLVSIDWSAIEPTIMANIAGESSMIQAYEAGSDIYQPVVEAAGVSRKVAKVVLLAAMYGQGKDLLAKNLGDARGEPVTPDEAATIQQAVMDRMPAVRNALAVIKRRADQEGFVVTIAGRPLSIPQYRNDQTGRMEYAGYKGQNYTVQGSAYDQLADTIVRGWDAGLAGTLRLAMHDEVVVDNEAAADWAALMRVPSADLCRAVERTPVLRTDSEDMGERWRKPE